MLVTYDNIAEVDLLYDHLYQIATLSVYDYD